MGVWDTSTPAGSDPISQGDDRIRELKAAIQEFLRGGGADGDEAVFPGSAPTTAPVFHFRMLRGTTAARPAAAGAGLYANTTTGTIQRSNNTTWDDLTENAAYEAIHDAVPAALASVAGVVTLPETGNFFNVSGTEAVTSLAGWSAGIVRIKWGSARLLTHGASFALQGSLGRNVVAGDVSTFVFTASATCYEIAFHGALSGKEAGEIFEWGGASVPAGALHCNGASLLRADYPRLFANIGTVHGTASGTTFNLPDHRGRFARGFDNAAGRDPNAATRTAANTGGATGDNVGSVQDDAFEAHTHTTDMASSTVVGPNSSAPIPLYSGGAQSGSTGGSETRPMNAGVMKCIKY